MEPDRQLGILYVSPYYDDRITAPAESLVRFPLLSALPREMHARGHQVRVLSLGTRNDDLDQGGVRYRWISPSAPIRILGRTAHRLMPHYGPAYYEPSIAMARRARSLQPDIMHVFGLTMDIQLSLLTLFASRDTRLVVHYHGGLPSGGRVRSRIQQCATRDIDAALFTASSQADPWVNAGLIRRSQVHEILETSSPFSGIQREKAREMTGMSGNPVYLSVGRLHPIKDPMTMLDGFARIVRRQPDARLYLYYLTDELFDEMTAFVQSNPMLGERVEFRGRVHPTEMEAIYSSADVLLQASTREWSGLAIMEAMSCGCIPVVSDIPSFSEMTARGSYGRLFTPGDPQELADAALSIENLPELSAAVRLHFERDLSFAAMAGKLERIYLELLESA